MKVVNQISELQHLPIPPEIQLQLHAHLTLPFNHNTTDAQEFWNDYSTQLALVESSDTDASIQTQNGEIHRLIHRAITTPEYVISMQANDAIFKLSLVCNGDDGAGFYLLISATNTAFPMFQLTD
jgi:hypothetical protein